LIFRTVLGRDDGSHIPPQFFDFICAIDPNQGTFAGPVPFSPSTQHEEEKIMSPYLMQPFVIGPAIVGLLFALTLLTASISDARR
jgi:hypothetical protein